jgi:hypothetical protein
LAFILGVRLLDEMERKEISRATLTQETQPSRLALL